MVALETRRKRWIDVSEHDPPWLLGEKEELGLNNKRRMGLVSGERRGGRCITSGRNSLIQGAELPWLLALGEGPVSSSAGWQEEQESSQVGKRSRELKTVEPLPTAFW